MKLVVSEIGGAEITTLSEEALNEVKDWFEKCNIELNLEGEDLVLYAEYQPPEEEGSMSTTYEPVGWIKLQDVIAYAVTRIVEDVKDRADARAQLFGISGFLREISRMVEEEAGELMMADWHSGEVVKFRNKRESNQWQSGNSDDSATEYTDLTD